MPANDRLHALDAVRAYALLLGVVLHSVAAFLEGYPIPAWFVESSTTATVIYYAIHMFRMSAFFLIAGFFARMVVERRGARAFIRDRAKRIGIPLFLFGPIVMVMIAVGFALGALPYGVDYLQQLASEMQTAQEAVFEEGAVPPEAAGGGFNTAHLWFLYYLLMFYVVALVIRVLTARAEVLMQAIDRIVAFTMRGTWAPFVVAAPLIVWFSFHAEWVEWIGLPAPSFLLPDPNALMGYGVAFGFGWLLHRQVPLLFRLQDRWPFFLAAAVALTAASIRIVGTTPVWNMSTLNGGDRFIYIVAYMVGMWCWIFGLVGMAVRFLSNESRVNRYLADASYWIYLMHLATIIFFINLLRPLGWHWAVQLLIYVGGSIPILLLSYHYLVRSTWIGAVLNGRRYPRSTPSRQE